MPLLAGAALAKTLPTIISGGAQLIGQGINAISQARANKQQLKYNQQMYAQQRKDSLADWEMQNKYGSPEQQMKRLQEAGLNPHLVYGKGTIDNFAGAVRSADTKQYSPVAPKLDLSAVGESISQYADLQLKQAQTDNLRSAIETSVEQRALIKANALKTAKDTDYTVFKQMRDELMMPYQEDMAREGLRKTRADTSLALGTNERAWQIHNIMKGPNLDYKLAEIAALKAKTANTAFERNILEAQAKKLKTETNALNLTSYQQKELNNLLQQKYVQDMLLTGENMQTQRFQRELQQKQFDQGLIDRILKFITIK